MSEELRLPESIRKLAQSSGGLYRRILEEDMRRTPEEKVRAWREAVAAMEAIPDSGEDWDEVLRNLGVDPATGRGLEP